MIRRSLISALAGALAGAAVTFFLFCLEEVTLWRTSLPYIFCGLPLAGLLIGWTYQYYGTAISTGVPEILREIEKPKSFLNFKMAPMIFVSTITTHLFGGSAGRESTAVQISAALADQLCRIFKLSLQDRRRLLISSLGAGFGAAIGTPWAGVIFGMEVTQRGRFRPVAIFESLISSWIAYLVCKVLHAPHSQFVVFEKFNWNGLSFFSVALAGLVFGMSARAFVISKIYLSRAFANWVPSLSLRPLLFGALLAIGFYFEGTHRFESLGISEIQRALNEGTDFSWAALKTLFTLVTVSSGFKGGEFIPLVFIGSTLGSAMSSLLPATSSLLAATGFGAIFAAASKTPLTSSIMLIELFGPSIAPFAITACTLSFVVSGQNGIYINNESGV